MAVWNTIMSSAVAIESRFDGEYYSPFYSDMDTTLSKITNVDSLGRLVLSIRKGIFDISPNRYRDKGIPLVRTLQIKSPLLSKESLVYIDAEDHVTNFSKTELVAGDIVFTKIGAGIGDVAVLPLDFERYNFSQNVAGASVNRAKISGFYLLAYLATKWGRNQLLRYMMPSGQGKLELRDIKKIKVVRLGDAEAEIGDLIVDAENFAREGQEKYFQAQQLLEAELGLDKLTFHKPVGYVANFSEALLSRRIDADYFQTPFRQIDDHLDKYSTAPLHSLVDITKGIEVGSSAYQTEGHPFLRVSNIKETGIELGPSDKYISPALYAELQSYRPQIGELLLTKDGSPGVAMALDQDCNGIISGGVVRLKPRTDGIPNEYLALVINSRACRMQVERECSGALILHWKPDLIRKLRVPILPVPVMDKIAELTTEAKRARRKSDELLEQAKTRVEQLIEEAVTP